VYSSAIVFSPRKSLVREHNTSKIPTWLKQLPEVETEWELLLQTLEGHLDWVSAVAYLPDGQHFVSGSDDKTVKVWDAATGTVDKTLKGHSGRVYAVAYSPNGQHIVSGSNDKTVKVWDAVTGTLIDTQECHWTYVKHIAASLQARMPSLESVATAATRQSSYSSQQRPRSQDVIRGDYLARSQSPLMQAQAQKAQQLHSISAFSVEEYWVYYEETAVLRLPPELRTSCYDTCDDQIVIGCENGRVVQLDIDRVRLGFILRGLEADDT